MDMKTILAFGDGLHAISKVLDFEMGALSAVIYNFCDEDQKAKWKDAGARYNEFTDADIERRGQMLGLDITVTKREATQSANPPEEE